jgi:hypothetical protein
VRTCLMPSGRNGDWVRCPRCSRSSTDGSPR